MNGPPAAGRLGFEAFGTAAGLALVTGALSVVAPFFTVLTGTLAALGVAGWTAVRRREGGVVRSLRAPGRAVGVLALGVGGGLYLDTPTPLVPFRALLLGIGLAALWYGERGLRMRGVAREETM